MAKIVEVMNKLKNIIALGKVNIEEIDNIEIELAMPLAEEYREYVAEFGAILADDLELTGVSKSKNRDVVQVTRREWAANNKIKHNMYVVENVGIDGIIIWQDKTGIIYESRPNNGAKKIANSLAEYIESKL